MFKFILFLVVFGCISGLASTQNSFEKDNIPTSAGDLQITFIGHASLIFTFNGKVIHVDPVSEQADYSKLPKADIILITHEHSDHFDLSVIKILRTNQSKLILTETCARKISGGTVRKNGDVQIIQGIKFEAVAAYNIIHKRNNDQPFHPKGVGNGYILTFGDKRIYVAGDTENIPEMKTLQGIDVAFLPMNLPYTMTPEMVADAARSFKPKILYPYHYDNTDTSKLVELLKDEQEIEIRIRKMN
ncbi:MAG TPA: MBL fold metallo-hydrolase [Candidatus Atribacteria bacterium]|nr:MBL fold metallo-hydrolase [Candidatus Atribacteria bacterium]